jgi:hypothetical protein
MCEGFITIQIVKNFSKIVEKLIFNSLNSCVQKYNILTDAQHGSEELGQWNLLVIPVYKVH